MTLDRVNITSRAPCPDCGGRDGIVSTVNGQDTVRCADCARFCYNAPRHETGREPRTLGTRSEISVSQRARILLRDHGTCALCRRADVALDVGHLISVRDGKALGLLEAELFNDENLAAMCATATAGSAQRRCRCVSWPRRCKRDWPTSAA